ncbi:MAG: helix-turn-helix domain-containing protein [Acidobacteria bacterium]|nr:helix-turn-helix domain-containing protein [Acidobacteriota bacterium]
MEDQNNVWLTVREAAKRARCGVKTVYREVVAGRLRAARVGGRRSLRFRPEWVDAWMEASANGGVLVGEHEPQEFAGGHAVAIAPTVHHAGW